MLEEFLDLGIQTITAIFVGEYEFIFFNYYFSFAEASESESNHSIGMKNNNTVSTVIYHSDGNPQITIYNIQKMGNKKWNQVR